MALVIPRPFLIGALAHQLWSVSGSSHQPDVSQLLIQPFINYNMENGWYLVSSPIIELGSAIKQVGFSDRRRLWQDFQDRRAAAEF